MIKRTYFMAVEKPHNDGNGSYSFNSCTSSLRSLIAQPVKVYDDMANHLGDQMKGKPGEKIQVVSFNRV